MVLDGSGLRCKVDARDESPRGFSSVQHKYRYASKAQHRRHSLSRDDIAWMAPAAVPTVESPLQAQGVGLAFAQGGPQLRVDARVLRRKLAARALQLAAAAPEAAMRLMRSGSSPPSRTLAEAAASKQQPL
jgi:hypothetical protein